MNGRTDEHMCFSWLMIHEDLMNVFCYSWWRGDADDGWWWWWWSSSSCCYCCYHTITQNMIWSRKYHVRRCQKYDYACPIRKRWYDSFVFHSEYIQYFKVPASTGLLIICLLLRQNDGEDYIPYVFRILELKQLSLQPGHHRDTDLTDQQMQHVFITRIRMILRAWIRWSIPKFGYDTWYIHTFQNRLDDRGLETMVLQMPAGGVTSWGQERTFAATQLWMRLWLLWPKNAPLPITGWACSIVSWLQGCFCLSLTCTYCTVY